MAVAKGARGPAYPDHLIRMVFPYPAGTTDYLGRLVAGQLKTGLDAMVVVVENKPGVVTSLGAEQVARAEPAAIRWRPRRRSRSTKRCEAGLRPR